LGAERIDDGVRAIEDAALVEYLAQHRIPLDITPTSNIVLGVFLLMPLILCLNYTKRVRSSPLAPMILRFLAQA
jgi:hypothetical protein